MSRWLAYKKVILLIVLVLVALIVIKYTAFSKSSPSSGEKSLRNVLLPVQNVATQLGHHVKGLVSLPFDMVTATKHYDEMAQKLEEAEGQLRELEEYRQENQRLKELLDFRSNLGEASGYQMVTAAIIARESGNWFGTIRINKGSEQGIASNMTVVSPSGLVGRVISVTEHSADVLLITDSRSGVGALTQKDRIPGIVQGVAAATGKLEMVQIPIASTVEKGQIVVTAGLESLYLKGIPIGTITSVSREGSGLFNSATVTPFVDFGRLEEVLVILTGNDGQSEVNTAAMSPPWGTAENSGSEANAG